MLKIYTNLIAYGAIWPMYFKKKPLRSIRLLEWEPWIHFSNPTHKCYKSIIGLSLGAKKEFVGKEIVQVFSVGF